MLARAHRLRQDRDIRRVQRFGRALRTHSLTLKVARHPTEQRFAFVVSTKVAKRATVRNRMKRQLRAIVLKEQQQFPKHRDYLFIVNRPKGTAFTREHFQNDITSIIARLR